MGNIHPTALVSPQAQLDSSVEVGAFAIVEGGAQIGAGCKIGHHALVSSCVRLGKNNTIGVGAVIGLDPQDLSYKGAPTTVEIGDGNTLREYVQVHRGTQEGSVTRIGNNNFIMGLTHIAHNCHLGDNIILANSVLLAGHVELEDFVFLSGNCLVHQFCRLGKHAMMRGGSRITLDLPPYCVNDEINLVRGINVVGLERRGFSLDQIRAVKNIYKDVFYAQEPMQQTVAKLLQTETRPETQHFLQFIQNSMRGICRPTL